MNFSQFVSWAFMALISGGVGWTAMILSRISKSIYTLNRQVATIIERSSWHEKALEKHEVRIIDLERNTKKSHRAQ